MMHFLYKSTPPTPNLSPEEVTEANSSTPNIFNSFQGGAYESLSMHKRGKILSVGTSDCKDIG